MINSNKLMKKSIRQKIARLIYYALGGIHGGTPSPPGSTCQLEFGEIATDGRPMEIATTGNNDGSELWLGWRSKWHVFYKAKHAHQLAWFILWTWWIKGTWCGLKRKIWYWGLHVGTEKMMASRENRTLLTALVVKSGSDEVGDDDQ